MFPHVLEGFCLVPASSDEGLGTYRDLSYVAPHEVLGIVTCTFSLHGTLSPGYGRRISFGCSSIDLFVMHSYGGNRPRASVRRGIKGRHVVAIAPPPASADGTYKRRMASNQSMLG